MALTAAQFAEARQRMVRDQLRKRGVNAPRVLRVLGQIPRELFVPSSVRDDAYADRALPIDAEQTISQPYMVAVMTQALNLRGAEKVLEIGTGSGYQAAILAALAASVVTIERHPELSSQAANRLRELGYSNVNFIVGDGTAGHLPESPYDRILGTAGAREIPPAWLEQLKVGGILVAPIGPPDDQVLLRIIKLPEGIQQDILLRCRFVPLVGEYAPEA